LDKDRNRPPVAQRLARNDRLYPGILLARLGENAPAMVTAVGPAALLAQRRTALFCSARAPGDAILRAHDAARRMRDEGVTVISGFHSPIEKECLKILLRGKQSIIICPARAIETMRIPSECRVAFEAGRVLFLSPFTKQPKRVTKESALRRNEVVAALADEVVILYAAPDGSLGPIERAAAKWGIPISNLGR